MTSKLHYKILKYIGFTSNPVISLSQDDSCTSKQTSLFLYFFSLTIFFFGPIAIADFNLIFLKNYTRSSCAFIEQILIEKIFINGMIFLYFHYFQKTKLKQTLGKILDNLITKLGKNSKGLVQFCIFKTNFYPEV